MVIEIVTTLIYFELRLKVGTRPDCLVYFVFD